MDPATILLLTNLIDLIASAIELAPEVNARKEKYLSMIRIMVEEGREPSDAEWAELLDDSDDVTEELRRVVAARRAGTG